jgi:hypothetical protein
MIAKAWLLLAAPIVMSAAPPIDFAPVPMFTHVRQAKQLFCGRTRGTGFYVMANVLASAHHVTQGDNCATDTELVAVKFASEKLDYSQSYAATADPDPMEIDCEGFVEGRQYIAVGYAHGAMLQRAVVVSHAANVLPGLEWEDYTTMVGTERFIPGMSGGPVIDALSGKAVGLVKGYNNFPGISYARALKDTPLCPGSKPEGPTTPVGGSAGTARAG